MEVLRKFNEIYIDKDLTKIVKKHYKNCLFFNCFGVETKFITNKGIFSFSDFCDGQKVTVLTHTGSWKEAKVRFCGKQDLYNVTFVRGRSYFTVRTTKTHQWILNTGERTTNLALGNRLYKPPNIVGLWDYENSPPNERYYWSMGSVYGDGTLIKSKNHSLVYSMVRLCGLEKEKFLSRFIELGYSWSSPKSCNGDSFVYTGRYSKTPPIPEEDGIENLTAFVHGYLDADGTKNINSNYKKSPFSSIQASDLEHINFIRNCFPLVGAYITRERDLTGQKTNFGIRPQTAVFGLTLDFGTSNASNFNTKEIKYDKVDDVWCLEVEEDHSFIFPNGIVTGNCTFDDISNIIFEDCVLTRSKFISNDVKKCLNFAVTLKCSSFKDVEISETIMNLILFLLASTKGNDTKRRKLIGIIGKEKVREMSNKLEGIE